MNPRLLWALTAMVFLTFSDGGFSQSICRIPTPESGLSEANPFFKNYSSRVVSRLRSEEGETQEGVRFKMERGGCTEFMETYSLTFPVLEQPARNVRFWLSKAADNWSQIARGAKHAALQIRLNYLNEFLRSQKPAENLVSFGPETDSVQAVVLENPPGKISVRLVMDAPR